MNRAERRQISRGNKQLAADLKYLDTPVTLKEAVQIARGAAEDVVSDYNQHAKPLQVAMSIQVEMIKDIIINSGLITEEEYHKRYVELVTAFNDMQREALKEDAESSADEEEKEEVPSSPNVSASVSDIEVKKV